MSTKGYGTITISDVLDGAQIWTTTTAPTSPNYTFTISNLSGDSSAEIKVGDLIFYSYYRYTVGSVGTTTVLAGNQQNLRGATGAAGLNNATVVLYQRAASSPSMPSGNTTYTFSTATLSGTLGNWTQTIPSGTDPLWATYATASANTTTDTIATGEWKAPSKVMENGVAGYNQATIFLYQRAASAPSKPSSAVTYTFSTGALSTTPSGWSRTIPASNGYPCYVTTAAAISQSSSVSIAANTWSNVVELVEDGFTPTISTSQSDGSTTFTITNATGTTTATISRAATWYAGTMITGTSTTETKFVNSGVANAIIGDHYLNTSTQNVYVCTTAGNPNNAKWVYEQNIKGATGSKGDNGYVHVKYSNDGGTTFTGNTGEDPGTYIGTYTDNTAADSTNPSTYTWSRIQGIGISSYKTQYYLSTSSSQPTGGTWSDSVPNYEDGCYYFRRDVTTWTDGSTTQGTPVLDNGITDANGNAYEATMISGELVPELIVGTHGTTATATWTGTSTVLSAIKSGTRIQYKMSSAGESNVTLNLTLKDGTTTTGAKPVYYNNTTRLGTQYGINAVLDLVYDGDAWRIVNPYTNSNTVGSYGATALTAGTNGIKKYSLVMKDSDTTWASFTTTDGTGTSKARNTVGFIPGKIFYMSANANYAAGAACSTCFDSYSIDLRYSTNCGTTLVAGKPTYLVGQLINGLFYLDATWWTQTEPTTEDGKVYIYLGVAYNTYCIYLIGENPMFVYYDGKFQLRDDAIASENYKKTHPGLGMKINYSAFNTSDSGEVYIHGFTNEVAADVDGYVYWNDVRRTVPKGMINPNAIVPYNRYIYIVLRLESAAATTGTKYMVWYNSGWKYAVTPTPTAVGGTWTWDESRDVVIGQFIEPGNESDVVEAFLYWPPRTASSVKTTNPSPYQYSQSAVEWYNSNGGNVINATTMLAAWADGAFSATTEINGGFIKAHTIQAEHLATDAIMSNNFDRGQSESSPFSATGTFLDLSTGNLYSPNFGLDNTYGKAFLNGEIIATNGRIGNSSSSNYWEIGTKMNYDQSLTGALEAVGNAYIQLGDFQLSNSLIDTRHYDTNRQITYLYDDGKYYDFGINSPTLTTLNPQSYPQGVDNLGHNNNFIYIRKHETTIPSQEMDWNYIFRIDKDGMIWINGESLDQKYAAIGSGAAYVVKNGDSTITGNLTVTGSINGTATQATKLTHSLTINGTAWDGSTNTTIGTLNVGYGGTGATSFTSGAALIGNGSGAIQTRAITNNISANYITGSTNLITANTLKFWNGAYDTSHNSNLEYVKLGKLGDVVTHDIDEFVTTDGGIIDGNLQVTGTLTVEDGLYGDLAGNASSSNKVNHDLVIKLNSGVTEGTNMFTFNGSSAKTVDITKDKLASDATQSVSGWMSVADKNKLDGIAAGAQVNSITGVKGGAESSYRTGNVNITAANIGLGNLTNNKQISGLASGTTNGHLITWGSDGYTVTDSGIAKGGIATKLTLSGSDYVASSNTITITQANLQSAVQSTSLLLMTSDERTKLASIRVSEGGTIDFSGVTASTPLTASVGTDKTVNITHNTSGVTTGTYKSVTVDTYGHVTGGTNPTTLSGYGITDAKIASGVITLGGNTITPLTASSTLDATKLSGTASISTTGNAGTATKFSSARSIALTGDTTGSASADGSSGWSIGTKTDRLSTVADNRAVVTTPNDYVNKFIFQGLKNNSTIGSPSTDVYSYVVGLRGWSDNSGGNAHELAFNNSGIFRRDGATTDWGGWLKLLDSGNYTSYTVTKTGSGASGTWGINITGTAGRATADGDGNTISSSYAKLSGATFTGAITTPYLVSNTQMTLSSGKVSGLATKTSRLYADALAISNPTTANDVGWIRVTGTGESDTVMEIATGDDGGAGEQIVVRQYNASNAIAREMKLLDTSGNTSIPGSINIGGGVTLQFDSGDGCLNFIF